MNDSSVAAKAAAEEWAVAVTDDGWFGPWHYRVVTESDIRAANRAGLIG